MHGASLQAVANKVMNQRLHIFYCSRVHANIIPPLLSAEAPDATGPSLFCGPCSLPGCKVFCLGGPELMRPLLLLQLTFKLLVK